MNRLREKFERLLSLYRSGDLETAAKALTAALRASPKDPNLLHLSAEVAAAQGEGARAVMFYRRALEAHPNWPEAEFNLAMALHRQKQTDEAIVLMTKLSRAHPDMPQAQEMLARFHQTVGDLPVAVEHWEKLLALVPEHAEGRAQCLLLKRQMCDWSFSSADFEKLPPQAVTVLTDDPIVQKKAAVLYAQRKFGKIEPLPASSWLAHQRLRIGYLSSDFHAHATAYLMAELFSLHNKDKFEVFAYSYGVDDRSAQRARLKREAEHFIELNQFNARRAAERIRQDEIDILVDLKGHTRGARLEIPAFRPAPVQIHWLGYPGTLGTDFIDYFVGDKVTVPPGDEDYFTEKVLRLPHCYQINDRQRAIAEPEPRAAYGLPETAFVLASFNQTYKITPGIFKIWCDVLRENPDAVLWLYQSNLYAPENLRRAAQSHGINPDRLLFASPLPLDQHLARYTHVDLAIDTHPVGGLTTTSDALWTGTPVVTAMGKSFVARVAASILSAADMSQLVCTTLDDYKRQILALMKGPDALANLKKRLVASRSTLPLFNTPEFVRGWEEALERLRKPPKTAC